MANFFTRQVERLGNAIGRAFGREPSVDRIPTGPLPGEERRGLGERIRDIVQPGRRELEQELAREREARADAERQAEEARRQADHERQERERIERERPQPPPIPPTSTSLPPRPTGENDPLAGIKPEISFGPKGQAGSIFSRYTDDQAMADLQRAADAGQRVTIRVHDGNGWHEVYVNVGRQAGKGIDAGHLINDKIQGRGLGDYIRGEMTGTSGSSNGTGGTPGYTFSQELDAFQVVAYS